MTGDQESKGLGRGGLIGETLSWALLQTELPEGRVVEGGSNTVLIWHCIKGVWARYLGLYICTTNLQSVKYNRRIECLIKLRRAFGFRSLFTVGSGYTHSIVLVQLKRFLATINLSHLPDRNT